MDRRMDEFICRENLAHYRRLLADPKVTSELFDTNCSFGFWP